MKSLRSTGTVDRAADPDQVVQRAGEAAALGEHRDGGRAAGLVLRGQRGRIGDVGQRALAGAGALDLGDHRDARTAEPGHRVEGRVDVLAALLQPVEGTWA